MSLQPTTGMDPISRRQVWNLLERAKKGRVIGMYVPSGACLFGLLF